MRAPVRVSYIADIPGTIIPAALISIDLATRIARLLEWRAVN